MGTSGRRLVATACTLVLAAWFLAGRRAEARAFDLNDASWEGCAQLLNIAKEELDDGRVVVQSVLDWQELSAADGLLILHPLRTIDAEEATAFMRAGGRLAIVDDYGRGELLLSHFRIRRRTLPSRPLDMLRGRPALPIAQPVLDTDGSGAVGLHPTVAEVERVVLNHGTGLSHPDLTPILMVRSKGDDPVAVAVAGQVDAGRLLAVGDSSAFINQMLRYPGNRRFAEGLVHYLVARERGGESAGRLFVFANEFDERAGFGGVMPWRKSVDRRLEEIRDGLAEWQRSGLPDWLHIALAVLAGLTLLWWAMGTLVRIYRPRVPRFARPIPLVAQGGTAGRAAVLAAPTSSPALALLELRSALVESLAFHFERPPHTRVTELVDEALGASDDPATETAVRSALASMGRAEAGVLAGTPPRVSRGDVVEAGRAVSKLLAACGAEHHRLPLGDEPDHHG